jgi:methyltransferase
MYALALLGIAFVPMIAESRRSFRNERALRARGATEPAGDVYQVMQVVYPACFLAMIFEGWLRQRGFGGVAWTGAVVFAAAKALKYWAIRSLGVRWTFRVLVPPGSARTRSGPYARLRHPNYIAVAGELAGMALLAQAPVSGLAAFVVFVALMLARIRVEERALG